MTAKNALIALTLAPMMALGLTLAGCSDDEGPAEKVGKQIDEGMEETGDQIENATDEMGDKAEEMGDKVEEATD